MPLFGMENVTGLSSLHFLESTSSFSNRLQGTPLIQLLHLTAEEAWALSSVNEMRLLSTSVLRWLLHLNGKLCYCI